MAIRTDERLVLRGASHADLPRIAEIEQRAHIHPWSVELLKSELGHAWSTVLLAEAISSVGNVEADPVIVGYIIFWLVTDEVHVLNVATDPDHRRRGTGRVLMLAAEDAGRTRSATISTLEVRRSNLPAIRLYETLGYKHVGVRPRYYSENNEDAFVMTKDLSPPA